MESNVKISIKCDVAWSKVNSELVKLSVAVQVATSVVKGILSLTAILRWMGIDDIIQTIELKGIREFISIKHFA